MSATTVSVLEGNTFVVSGRNGDVDDLKRAFDRDFWLDDRGQYALALDGENRRAASPPARSRPRSRPERHGAP